MHFESIYFFYQENGFFQTHPTTKSGKFQIFFTPSLTQITHKMCNVSNKKASKPEFGAKMTISKVLCGASLLQNLLLGILV